MKKLILISISIILYFSIYAQLREHEGYYITPDSDTVHGKFLIPVDDLGNLNLARIQWRILFENDQNDIRVFKPGEIDCFYIQDSIESLIYFTLELYMNDLVFVRQVMDGQLRLFAHYSEELVGAKDDIRFINNLFTYPRKAEPDYYVVKKPNQELVKVMEFSMYRILPEYLSDNPSLAEKIKDKELKYPDVYSIVRQYNDWHKKEAKKLTTSVEIDLNR
ncbi:MAG: hypothetical protein JW731_03470 [Bacteroidales bacterium]|nr:hypothetical protein [Bacteroidales bacterium]